MKNLIKKVAQIFADANSAGRYSKIAEDRYNSYGISQYLHQKAVEESAEWIRGFIDDCIIFPTKKKLYGYAVEQLERFQTDSNHLYLEFGVHTGTSINFFAKGIQKQVYGFDTFTGMPEEWKGWNVKKGQFTMDGKFPPVENNVKLIKGLIEDTLPGFLEQHQEKKIAFIHIDTDIYAPAKTVLSLCKDKLMPGSIILFDEIHSYTSWKAHEYKALKEELNDASYKFVAFSDYKQGMIQMV